MVLSGYLFQPLIVSGFRLEDSFYYDLRTPQLEAIQALQVSM